MIMCTMPLFAQPRCAVRAAHGQSCMQNLCPAGERHGCQKRGKSALRPALSLRRQGCAAAPPPSPPWLPLRDFYGACSQPFGRGCSQLAGASAPASISETVNTTILSILFLIVNSGGLLLPLLHPSVAAVPRNKRETQPIRLISGRRRSPLRGPSAPPLCALRDVRARGLGGWERERRL